MEKAFIIFPNSLFEIGNYPKDINNYHIFIIEDPLFFNDKSRITNFNKKKLILHRASMKYYYNYLNENKLKVKYIDYSQNISKYDFLKKYKTITLFNPTDHLLIKRLEKSLKKDLIILDSPLFLLTNADINKYMLEKTGKHKYFHKVFYQWQVKNLKIPYITKSYDTLNRNKIPENEKIPEIKYYNTDYVKEASNYINNHKDFSNNYGNTDNFIFPVTHKESEKLLSDFLETKFKNFGTYQDSIKKDEPYLFHSLLSALLNIGLITPKDVIEKTIKHYQKYKNKIGINNYEGFIRQIIGWREYMRMLYLSEYDNLTKSNYFELNNKITKKYYTGNFGIPVIDDTIKNAFNNGYLHHIERLMVILNFMILTRINPKYVYKWFMEFAVDSYDWVMIGNIYGMGYYSTITTTKPYLASSNYITNMSSDYQKNKILDGLFYKFLFDKEKLLKGGASIYLRNLAYYKKLDKNKKDEINKITNSFI